MLLYQLKIKRLEEFTGFSNEKIVDLEEWCVNETMEGEAKLLRSDQKIWN